MNALNKCKEALSQSTYLLQRDCIDSEAEVIVQSAYRFTTGKKLSRLELYSIPNHEFTEEILSHIQSLTKSRACGVPLQHLTGVQSFFEHEYEINSDALIPRPETEILVQEVILNQTNPMLGLELGLGSGIISIELLHHFPQLKMLASELSVKAAELATRNAERILGKGGNQAGRLEIISIAEAYFVLEPFQKILVEKKADLIVSNPPYLAKNDEIEEEVLNHEPHCALFPPTDSANNEDALFFYRKIARQAVALLSFSGMIYLEIPSTRAAQIESLFLKEGWLVEIKKDLSSRERVLIAKRNPRRNYG